MFGGCRGVFKASSLGGMGGGLSSLSERLFPDRQASMLLLASRLSSTAFSHHAVLPSVFSFVEVFSGIFTFLI